MSTFKSVVFNSHTVHNPDCDIIEGHLDVDTMITYGVYVKGDKTGSEFMEYYSGENYVHGSKKKSFSRVYHDLEKIPTKYKNKLRELKTIYEVGYKNK